MFCVSGRNTGKGDMENTAVICGIEVTFGCRTRDEVAALTFEYLDGIRVNGDATAESEAGVGELEEVAIAST